MAIIHRATIDPTKPELLAQWVPTQTWGAAGYDVLGAYRFDDPAGEVGIEVFVLGNDEGHLLQVPLTYRGAPLPGGEDHLVGTMAHSVLGRRWVYDACGDPVFAAVLASVLLGHAVQAVEEIETDKGRQTRDPGVRVTVSGTAIAGVPAVDTVRTTSDSAATNIETGALRMVVRRRLDLAAPSVGGEPVLTGTWAGQDTALLFASVD